MDVLIAMGSSVAYVYSLLVMLGLIAGHVYFETAAVIITLIRLGKFLEARAKGRTSEANQEADGPARQNRAGRAGRERTGSARGRRARGGMWSSCAPGRKFRVDGVVVEGPFGHGRVDADG